MLVLGILKRASEAGANIIDVISYPFITDVDKVLAEFPVTEWCKYKNHFKVGGVKITMDGSPQGRTAFFKVSGNELMLSSKGTVVAKFRSGQ